jgi:hypothetical protein
MVLIHVIDKDGAHLSVQTGRELNIPGSPLGRAERLRLPKDSVAIPTTWADWIAANPGYPLAQIREPDKTGRRYIYIPIPGLKPVSGTCDAGESPVVCAARELWEETGLDLRGKHDRFTPTNRDFTVTISAAEKTEIRDTLNARIAAREGEIFAFQWRPKGGRRTRRKNGRRHRKTKRHI